MLYREIELGETLKDIRTDLPSPTPLPDLGITLLVTNQTTQESENVTLCTSAFTINEFLYKYGDFKLVYPDFGSRPDPYTDKGNLVRAFKQFLSNTSLLNYSKLYEVFSYSYNPIENYDKYSEITIQFSGTEKDTITNVGKEKNTIEYIGSDKNTVSYKGETTSKFSTPENGYTDVSTNSRSPENDSVFYGTEKTESKIAHREEETTTGYTDRTDETEHSFENRKDSSVKEFENRIETNQKEFNNRQDLTTEHTHGNIGVSTPMDMAMKELEGRKFDLAKWVIHKFIMEYCIL